MPVSRLAERFALSTQIPPGMAATAEHRYLYLLSKKVEADVAVSMISRVGYSTADALKSEPELTAAVKRGAPYWAALGAASYVVPNMGLKVNSRSYRDWVLLQYDKVLTGIPFFDPKMAERIIRDGRLTEDQMIADWRRRCLTLQGIIDAHRAGAFTPISHGKELEGLGVEPVTMMLGAAVIAIVLITVIVAIAYVVTEGEKTTAMTNHYRNIISDVCYDGSGKFVSSPECLAAVKNATDPALAKSGADRALQDAVKYGAIVIGVLMLVNMGLNRAGIR